MLHELPEQLMTKNEVARLLKVSMRTVERMAADGRLPPPVRFGRALVRWRRTELMAFCRESVKFPHGLGR